MIAIIQPTENVIAGGGLYKDGSRVPDPSVQRIYELIEGYLQEIARSSDGWSVLYQDPQDGRYWELTYPQSDSHGGGPPRLSVLGAEVAEKQYEIRCSDSSAERPRGT